MKYCLICERNYEDDVQVCQMDGATLKILGSRQDRYLGKLIKGRYKVLKKLGEGGMGTVYLAEQMSIGRKVALKLLQGNYATDDEFIARFRREARLAASLNHPNIVTVYDFDQSDDESLFIAMEYLDGGKLSDIIRGDGPLSIGRAARLGLQIAEGLEAAHRAGVIHRDIKPDNIMVMGEVGIETIKLMDFGIARLRDSGAASRLTRADVIMGTPAYMAPEQAEGAEVSEQTDIYALGIVLYEMLSGSVPFKASTPSAVLVKQIQEAPVPLRKLRREIPASIERVVMRALEKKPQKRQRDMREVVQGLQKVDVGRVEEAPAGKTVVETLILPRKGVEKLQRLKKPFLWAGGVLAIVLTLMAFWFFGASGSKSSDVKKIVSLGIQGKRQLIVGEKTVLRVGARLSDGSETDVVKNLDWHSSDDSVVAVSGDGQVVARKDGFADVTVRHEGVTSPPLTLMVRGESRSAEADAATVANKVQEHIKTARSYRDRGEYSSALAELAKAKSLDPADKTIRTELEGTKSACLTERSIGTTSASCE
jgi:predicted Ser/Thr protein kinase